MSSVTGGPAVVASQLRWLDSSKIRPQSLSAEEVQETLARMQELKEAANSQAPQLAYPAAETSYAPAQIGSALVAAETGFRAQQIAQEGAQKGAGDQMAALTDEDESEESEAVKAFLDYMSKTPEERYFESFLKSKGMTKEEFEALPPEEKQALLKEFEEAVKQQAENHSAEKTARAARSELL